MYMIFKWEVAQTTLSKQTMPFDNFDSKLIDGKLQG